MWQRSLKNVRGKGGVGGGGRGRESADRKHRYLMAVCKCRFNVPIKRVCPAFRGLLLGLSVLTTLNFILPGKEAH